MNFAKLILLTGCLGLLVSSVHAADYYVATSGNDTTGNGTIGSPFRTIQKAANTAVAGDNVVIRAGTYRETVRPAASGTALARITYKAFEAAGAFEEVIISGADPVSGWTAHDTSGGKAIYKSSAMNWNLSNTGASFGTAYRNQIFVNGGMMVLARWPNVPADRITRLSYQDLALVSSGSGQAGSTSASAWIDNANVNAAFPAGYWTAPRLATARVFLSPATMIWGMSVKIASQSTNRLNLDATGTGFSFTTAYYYPTTNNRFFLYDWYDALDTAGEYWKDTATNTLYLWAPGGVNPATLNIEAKRRDFGLSLGQRSYLTFRGIKLFSCTVESDSASTSLEFTEIEARYIGHIDNYAPTFSTAANPREFYLRGDGHVVTDSYFYGSAVVAIGASGTNMRIENNVIRDFGYAHYGSAILARNGGVHGNRTLASKNQFLRNTAFNGGHTIVTTDPALDVKYNRIYNSHLRGSDVGAVGIASTDGLGSEIAYNVISDALGPKDNGVLYGSFGIYFDYECRNYTVHHNIVYNTTGSSYQLMPNRAAFLAGVTNMGMKFYHNTGDGDFGLIAPQDIPGVDVRNNLVRRFLNAGNGNYTSLPNVQFSNNTAYATDAAAPYRNRLNRDLRFATGSSTGVNAGTVISPYSDGFVGAAPDTGALEFDQAAFIAGATVTQRQLSLLTVTNIAQSGNLVDVQFGNLPEGRSPALTLQVRIGSGAFGGAVAYDYATATWRVVGVNKGALTGLQSVSVRIGVIGTPVTLDSPIDVGGGVAAPEIAVRGNEVNIIDGDNTPSGTDHTIFADAQAGDPVGTTQSFVIYNFGSVQLNIGAITFTGANAADFSVVTAPPATLAAEASATFVVRFKPSATGVRTAILHLANNDPDEADFNFTVQGQGTAPLPELYLPNPQLTSTLTSNSTGSVSLPIQNTGLANLTWSLASPSGTGLYSWADSVSGGPAFNWYNIQSLGTKHWGGGNDDEADTVVTLPFTFPYYGTNYSQLTISIDGILAPGSAAGIRTYWSNLTLPNSSAPINLIAPFWDDLVLDASAQIRSYAVDATTFVILYENAKSYSSINRITFQVVIRSNGQITVQYLDNQFTRSYTIGLQNAARTLGPQVAYSNDTSALQGIQLPVGTGINRAITFFPPASFVASLSPTSGSIPPGSSASVSVNLSASGLALGTYQSTITLTTNDADEASVQIPLSLQVVASIAPPVVTPSQAASGTVGSALSYQLTASNAPTSYTLVSGSLPPGVSLNTTTGVFSGTPSALGSYAPTFTATNAAGTSPAVSVTITITAVPSALAYEPFTYTSAATLAGQVAPSPFGTWSGSGGTINSTGLSYGNLTTSGLAGLSSGGGRNFLPVGSTINSGIHYISFLAANLGTANLYAGLEFRVATSADTDNRFIVGVSNNSAASGQFMAQKASGGTVFSTSGVARNDATHLFVIKIDYTAGAGNHVLSWWLDPAVGGAEPPVTNTTLTGDFAFSFIGIAKFGTAPNAVFDEIRRGNSWSSVTPSTALTGLQTFRSNYGLAANGSQDLLTPAGEGVANILKYAFNLLGSSTGQAAALATPNASVLAPGGFAGLPLVGVESGTGKLQLTFIRRKASAAPGINYAVEFSDALASWAVNVSATESATSLDSTFERVTVTDSGAVTTKRFVRVKVAAN